ncbi:hypothetical protein BS47DRAFT_881838 [Hydnum rufescens UP504]|uniref:F-box domain-containing protein n=1 Tax=Hydnum rufescens UP504 TaxID=1448309 RepID=A0A9P6ADT3_9AGAM|nr:hypothetical protein BS47DRAFT_881838 [Hydnum rufescens UP504]
MKALVARTSTVHFSGTRPINASLSLFTLPLQILIRIFALLEGYQIAKCGAVCTYFKHVIESSILLQYFIKLDMFGYTNGSGSLGAPAVAATRLNPLESTSTPGVI